MQKKADGFTLIEILIVILLISIIIGTAMVIPNSNRAQTAVNEEASKLAFMFNKASEKALLSGKEVGFFLEDERYHWEEWDRITEKWQPLPEREWVDHILPEDITAVVNRDDENSNKLKEAAKGPVVVFYTDGTMTPVNLIFYFKNDSTYSQALKSDGVTSFAE